MSLATETHVSRREAWKLGLLFGALYFVQGVAEPTEGIVVQPVRSLLVRGGDTTAAITLFAALLAVPWCFKPLYGLCSDFLPWWGLRRKNYLMATSAAATAAFMALAALRLDAPSNLMLFALLVIPTAAVAWSDVVVDALMIETGQPRGLTGRLQSIQWTAMWGATILCGWLGGELAHRNLQHLAFFICGGLMFVMFLLSLFAVREAPPPTAGNSLADDLRDLRRAAGSPPVRFAALFLFVGTFNPLTNAFVYSYATGPLGLDDAVYGDTVSLFGLGSLLGSVTYGLYCRRFHMRTLLHGSIVFGLLANVVYLLVEGSWSLAAVSLIVGFLHMSGTMAQLDLAARSCPVRVAGSVFATIMALSNVSAMGATAVGGWIYDAGAARWNPPTALAAVIFVGATITASCWLLMPFLPREIDYVAVDEAKEVAAAAGDADASVA